ncbi:MAG: precorrin-4 C(11)-methyltransferase [Spirochaetes bacterium]|nr:precorrin-4 C(11)-methyltransferase [Spirochaetota bacterium]
MTKVYFIGAGPGDPELLTIKGKKIIDQADIIIYAGSLVNKEILKDHKKDAQIYNSAEMTLEEITGIMLKERENDCLIARVHTGDPSIYGAIKEQIDFLHQHGIPYQVIPGVSSFTAAAAILEAEYTLPSVSQTVICTRIEGRTKVPAEEKLSALAKHQSSMAIFLSIGLIDQVIQELLTAYQEDTPCAVVYKASWPDQKILKGKLNQIVQQVKENQISKHALLLVGRFLDTKYEKSKLYDKNFSHGTRKSR